MPDKVRNSTGSADPAETLIAILDSQEEPGRNVAERGVPSVLNDILARGQRITDAPVVKPEIKKAIVAFVDMLGTSALMEDIKEENAEKVYGTITGIAELFQDKFNDFSRIYADSKCMIISDSFVISVPYEPEAFNALVLFLADFQHRCLVSYAEAMRGAVSVGNLLVGRDNKIIGPAFIRAHKIEKENAIFPRIVVDKRIVEDKELCPQTLGLPIALDKDGVRYVDFMAAGDADMSSVKEQTARRRLEFEKDDRKLKILQKWDWLQTFLEQKSNACVDCCKVRSVVTGVTP